MLLVSNVMKNELKHTASDIGLVLYCNVIIMNKRESQPANMNCGFSDFTVGFFMSK